MKGYTSEYQVFGTVINRIPLKYTSTIKENSFLLLCSVSKSVLRELI